MIALVLIGSVQSAMAGFEFYLDSPASYSQGAANTTVAQNLYLRATAADTLQSVTSATYEIVFDNGGTTFNASNFTINSAFTAGTNFVNNITNGIRVRQTETTGVAAASNQVLLGTLQLNLGSAPSLTVLSYNPNSLVSGSQIAANFNSGGLAALESSAAGSGVFNSSSSVSVVPEPSSLAVLGLVAGLGFARRRRK